MLFRSYEYYLFNKNICIESEPKLFVETYYKHIFFKKHVDWQQEGERRILCVDGPDYLSIMDCIEFVILGRKFGAENHTELTKVIMNKKLTPHDFTIQTNSVGRILPIDYAFKILETVEHINDPSNEYINFLKQEGY